MKDYAVSVEDLSHLDFIGIESLMSPDEAQPSIAEVTDFWKECINDGTIEQLKALSGADMVYGIFSGKNSVKSKFASYRIACRCTFDTEPGSFQKIHVYPARYAVLSAHCKSPTTIAQARHRLHILFWQEWLPETEYYSLIDTDAVIEGTASFEVFKPLDMDAEEFEIQLWYPLGKK